MSGPSTVKFDGRASKYPGLVDYDRLLLMWIVERRDPEYGPSVFRIVIGNPVNDSPEGFFDFLRVKMHSEVVF
jgi:hypothetical protein